MKPLFKIVLFALCVNVSCGLAIELTLPYSGLIRFPSATNGTYIQVEGSNWVTFHNYTEFMNEMSKMQAEGGLEAPTWLQSITAAGSIWKQLSYVVTGFPVLLNRFGVPGPIVTAIVIIIGLFFSLFLIEVIFGRNITGEE